MTPTEQVDDRAKLIIEMSNLLHRHFQAQRKATVEAFANAQGDLVNFITADRKRVALEARIDELKKIEIGGDNIWTVNSGTDTAMLIEERIAELKRELDK